MKNEMTAAFHVPVLLEEVISGLRIATGKWYVDATAGGGGHTRRILATGGNVIAIDQDASAIAELEQRFTVEIREKRLIPVKGNFSKLENLLTEQGRETVAGVLCDLGMSTFQLKASGRGFSFLTEEPLDMRMSAEGEVSAAEIVNDYSFEELTEIFARFGEETLARQIAERIVEDRQHKKMETTTQLSQLVSDVYKEAGKWEKIHPATRIYQALRIAVNSEINNLKVMLPQAVKRLEPGGRIALISFHSLEDRIVKLFFLSQKTAGTLKIITKKPVMATEAEILRNPASRSAKLRIAEKI